MKSFINEQDNKRIRIINFLIQMNREVTFSEICTGTNYSSKTVRNLLFTLKDNTELKEKDLEIKYDISGKILSIKINKFSLTDISFFYLEKSMLFLMIKEIFLHGEINKKKFCEQNYISTSNFSRYKNKLVKILSSFSLDLSKNCQLLGNEYIIRDFLFHCFSNSYSKWIFSKESYYQLDYKIHTHFKTLNNISFVNKESLRLVLYIFIIRNSQKKNVDNFDFLNITTTGNASNTYKEIADYIKIENNNSPEQEKVFLYLQLLKYQIIVNDEFNFEEIIIDKFDNHELNKIIKDASTWIKVTFFNRDKTYHHAISKNTQLLFLYSYIGFIDPRNFLYIYDKSTYFHKNNFENQIFELIYDFLLKVSKQYNMQFLDVETQTIDSLANQFYLMVFSFLAQLDNNSSEVYIHIFMQHSNRFIEKIIEKKLSRFFLNRIRFTNHFDSQIDLYISDKNYFKNGHNIDKIIIPTFSDVYSFNRLYEVIQTKIEKKLETESPVVSNYRNLYN